MTITAVELYAKAYIIRRKNVLKPIMKNIRERIQYGEFSIIYKIPIDDMYQKDEIVNFLQDLEFEVTDSKDNLLFIDKKE